MYTAQKLRQENIAEYLIYMWQVEDLLRAARLDMDTLRRTYLSRFSSLTEEQRKEQEQWYAELIDMMHSEGVAEKGHLQICKNVVQSLAELHQQLIKSQNFPYYRAAYYNALPIIVALREKGGQKEDSELDTCFSFLYGIMLLRLQQKPVSADTEQALKTVTTYIGMLSDYYKKDREKPLDF